MHSSLSLRMKAPGAVSNTPFIGVHCSIEHTRATQDNTSSGPMPAPRSLPKRRKETTMAKRTHKTVIVMSASRACLVMPTCLISAMVGGTSRWRRGAKRGTVFKSWGEGRSICNASDLESLILARLWCRGRFADSPPLYKVYEKSLAISRILLPRPARVRTRNGRYRVPGWAMCQVSSVRACEVRGYYSVLTSACAHKRCFVLALEDALKVV